MTTLAKWLKLATPKQREDLAAKAGTSTEYLRHLASKRRTAGIELAFKIEQATVVLQTQQLPYVKRETLNKAWKGMKV